MENKASAMKENQLIKNECCGKSKGYDDSDDRKKNGWAGRQWFHLKPYHYGIVTAVLVVAFYLGLITLTSDWYNAKAQFYDYRWWIVSLAGGLGIQVGLYTQMRRMLASAHLKAAASGMAASGGMSGVAMALCCSHYLAGLLPLIGLPFFATAVAGLERYQTQLFIIGVFSNILGLAYMIWVMSKKDLLPSLRLILRDRRMAKIRQEIRR